MFHSVGKHDAFKSVNSDYLKVEDDPRIVALGLDVYLNNARIAHQDLVALNSRIGGWMLPSPL